MNARTSAPKTTAKPTTTASTGVAVLAGVATAVDSDGADTCGSERVTAGEAVAPMGRTQGPERRGTPVPSVRSQLRTWVSSAGGRSVARGSGEERWEEYEGLRAYVKDNSGNLR